MALDTTPKSTTGDSYISESRATFLLSNFRLAYAEWTAAGSTTREASLRLATRLLDSSFVWMGSKRTLTQSLRWPRAGVLDQDELYVDPDAIPKQIEMATADLALAFLQRDRFIEPELIGQGFSKASVGTLSVEVDPEMVLTTIPRSIVLDLEGLGTLNQNASTGMRVINVNR